MEHSRRTGRWVLGIGGVLLLLSACVLVFTFRDRPPQPQARPVVQRAWRRAQELGNYRFVSDVTVRTLPAPALANVGRSSREERLHLEGAIDLPARSMRLSLWQGEGSVLKARDGLEIRIEGDRAYGREFGADWQEIDDFSGAFAPGQDPMAYLAGAKNITSLGSETRVLPAIDDGGQAILRPSSVVQFSRYGFELDGPALATHLRMQFEQSMRDSGELPPGVSLEIPTQFRDASGEGEVWIDDRGLPLRLTLRIAYPEEESGERAESRIQTDFSGFPPEEVAGSPRFLRDPAAWVANSLGLDSAAPAAPSAGKNTTLISVIAGCLVLIWLLIRRRRSRTVYIALILVIILSMVISPLAQSHRLAAFARGLQARQQEAEGRQEAARSQRELKEVMLTSNWDPHQALSPISGPVDLGDPQRPAANEQPPVFGPVLSPVQTAVQSGEDEDEPDPESDEDGDTLTYIEEQRLGTDPENADSDNDQLRDDLEVEGFVFAGERWYTDPLNADTNNDGLLDTRECWMVLPLDVQRDPPWTTPCDLDTDGDLEPDIFDRDNDGDGVPDRVDLSPFETMAGADGYFDEKDPFQFQVNDLQRDEHGDPLPVFVDVQLRPTNAEHLTYAYNVLDWPTGDLEGQIQRGLKTTFATTDVEGARDTTDPRSRNGDMRLVPLLAITVPYKEGHSRDLPIKASWTAPLTPTTPLELWLDTEKLEPYGVSVRYADDEGTVAIYVPIHLVSDETDGAQVAFGARLPYWPEDPGDWGPNHQVRVEWLLQMLTDHCTEQPPEGEDVEAWCSKPGHRSEELQIVQTYPEEWFLTGFVVREDHGVEVAIAFEDPAHEVHQEVPDQNLWMLGYGLDSAFITGRGTDTDGDGTLDQRDITIPEIQHRFDSQSNRDIPEGDDRLWGIPRDTLRVSTYSLQYQDMLAYVPMTYTKEILNQYFIQDGQPLVSGPTLLFAREEHYRAANLSSGGKVIEQDGSSLTVNMAADSVTLDTLAAMSWEPYRYHDGEWEPYPMDEYWDLLDDRLAKLFPPDPDDPDGQEVADGQVIVAKCFYLGLVQGTGAVVQSGDTVLEHEEAAEHDDKLAEEAIEAGGKIILTVVELAGQQILKFAGRTIGYLVALGIESVHDLMQTLGAAKAYATEELGGWTAWNNPHLSRTASIFNRMYMAALVVSTIFAVSLFLVSIWVHSPVVEYIQLGLAVATGLVMTVAQVGKMVSEIYGAYKEIGGLRAALGHLWGEEFEHLFKAANLLNMAIGMVIEVLIAFGVFIAEWAMSHVRWGSLAWDQMLADTISRAIVAVMVFALNLIPIVGEMLYALVNLINSLVALICALIGEDFEHSTAGSWVCGGISGMLAKALSWLFYGQHVMVDMEDERWEISAPIPMLRDPDLGIAVGNSLGYQLSLTNTIHLTGIPVDWKAAAYAWQYSMGNLEKSSFAYAVSPKEDELHSDLSLGHPDMDWQEGPEQHGKRTRYIVRGLATHGASVELTQAGINREVPLYLNEGYAIPVQECIGVPTPPFIVPIIPVCWIRSTADTNNVDLAETFKWDVFPATLDGFYDLVAVENGQALSWGQDGDLRFPRLKDADGDGLRNSRDGGSDPDDSQWDADNDGLSDYLERQIGTDPRADTGYDTDGDGLSDGDEVLGSSNPNRPDSDADGLRDGVEVTGWEFAYGFGDDGSPKITWVTADPLLIDPDGDTLTDFQEHTFRYHPLALSDPNVLGFKSDLTERSPGGDYSATDSFVRPGDELHYQASVRNKMSLTVAQGLLSSRFPEDQIEGQVAPRTFVLYPQDERTMAGDLEVLDGAPSGLADLTQIAGAEITDAREGAGHALLLLHFEEPITATTFVDSSGSIPPHHGTCDDGHCPERQVEGYEGAGLRFDAQGEQQVSVEAVDISTGDFGISLWFKTSQHTTGLFSTADGSVGLYMQDQQVCALIITNSGDKVRCTPAQESFYADGEWHHLAHTFGQSVGGQKLYLDGELKASGDQDANRANPSPQSGLRIGYSQPSSRYYTGSLDELSVTDRALAEQDVEELYGRPLLSMHLDEPRGSSTFFKDADGFPAGKCSDFPSLQECPIAGQPGVIGTSVEFRGNDPISFLEGQQPDLDHSTFSLAAWLYPMLSGDAAVDSHAQGVLGSHSDAPHAYPTLQRVGKGVRAGFGDGSRFVEFPTMTDVLKPGAWNHVVVTYGQNQAGVGQFDLYVDGRHMGSHALQDFPLPAPSTEFEIGRSSYCADVRYEAIYSFSPMPDTNDYKIDFHDLFEGLEFSKIHRGMARDDLQSADETATYCFQGTIKAYVEDNGWAHLLSGDHDFTPDMPSWDDQGTSRAAAEEWQVKVGEYNTGYERLPLLALRTDHVNPSIPFRGRIDELLVYKYPLSVDEVEALYRSQSAALELPFDDPPGTYRFQDATGGPPGTCSSNLVSCPTGGVAGRVAQAAWFDGADDHVSTSVVLDQSEATSPGATMMAWVYPVSTSEGGHNVVSTGVYQPGWGLWRSGGQWAVYLGAEPIYHTGASAQVGEWQHIAAVFDPDAGQASFYLNGAPVGTAAMGFPENADQIVVGCNNEGWNCFDGRIDEVRVARRPMSAEEIQAVYQSAPQFLLHMEELPGATLFADDSEHGHDGSCSGDACPTAGTKGQIGLVAKFDGVDDGLDTVYEVPVESALWALPKTVVAWVYSDSTSDGQHVVIGTDKGLGPAGSWAIFREGGTWKIATASGGGDYDTGAAVKVGQWQHLAAVFRDSGGQHGVKFYLNGSPTDPYGFPYGMHDHRGHVTVGYTPTGPTQNFDGRIDEVTIYERSLSAREIQEIYLYQGQWVEELQTFNLTVDNDEPITHLMLDTDYLPDAAVVLMIKTEDATSPVVQAEWRVDDGVWQEAPPCSDADLGAAWCPTFDPAQFRGEGRYHIQTRAADRAGNISSPSSDTVYVDGTPPASTADLESGDLLPLQPVPDQKDVLTLALSGEVSDPPIAGGEPGSGVRAVRVTLLDTLGAPAGAGAQVAELKAGTWSVEYLLDEPVVSGPYTVQVEAEDQVGNVAVEQLATIYLDHTPPNSSLVGFPPGGAVLTLHLDETAGATTFSDSSGYGHHAACNGPACPTAGVSGRYGGAVELDGSQTYLSLQDPLDFARGDYTVAAWFRSDGGDWGTLFAASGGGDDAILVQLSPGGKLRYVFSPPGDSTVTNLTGSRSYDDGAWHHAAAMKRGDELLLYVDGEIVTAKTDGRTISVPLEVTLGQHASSEYYQGRLDEVSVFPVALRTTEVRGLALDDPGREAILSGVVSEVPLISGAVLEMHLEEPGSATDFADSSDFDNHGACTNSGCPSENTGGYFGRARRFDGADDYISIPNSSSLYSLNNNLTVAAWIKPDHLSGTQTILGYSGLRGLSFGTDGAHLRFSNLGVKDYVASQSALNPGEWQHVAAVMDGDNDLSFYLNGTLVGIVEGTEPIDASTSPSDSLLLGMRSAEPFSGVIDEVHVIARALSQDEVLALGTKRHAGVARLEMAYTPTSPGSTFYNPPMPEGAVLYLPFDDNEDASGSVRFLDISGQRHDGQCTGQSCPSLGHAAHRGTAALFDGEHDFVSTDVNLDQSAGTSGATMAAWVYPGSTSAQKHVVIGTGSGQDEWALLRLGDNWAVADGAGVHDTGVAVLDGAWQHVAAVFDPWEAEVSFYLDGEMVNEDPILGHHNASSDLCIGADPTMADFFDGLIDELVVLDRPLAAREVRDLYLGSETVLHLPMDERWAADGSPLLDLSGFGNEGLLHGQGIDHAVEGPAGSAALSFDGVHDYVTTQSTLDFARGDYAATAWFRSTASNRQAILSATDPTGDHPGILLELTDSGTLRFLHRSPAGTGGGAEAVSSTTHNDGDWHHLAAIKAGTQMSLYVDGEVVGSASEGSAFDQALDITFGQQGRTSAKHRLEGALDDVRVYARALSSEEVGSLYANRWMEVPLAETGPDVVRTWYEDVSLPRGLEGHYQVDLRGWDIFENRNDSTDGLHLWGGTLDTLSPRVRMLYTLETDGSESQIRYQFQATDFYLTEQGLQTPCPVGTPLGREYYNAAWYRTVSGQTAETTHKLYSLGGQCVVPFDGEVGLLTACDSMGNCAMVEAVPAQGNAVAVLADNLAAHPEQTGADTQPPTVSVDTSTVNTGDYFAGQIILRGTVMDDVGVDTVQVWLDGRDPRPAAVHGDTWTAFWYLGPQASPDGESYTVTAEAVDWAGNRAEATRSVQVDVVPPSSGEMTVSYRDSGGSSHVLDRVGMTIREENPTLEIAWTEATDGSGLAGYRAGWRAVDTSGASVSLSDYAPAATRLDQYIPGEAQRLFAEIVSQDLPGNEIWQGFGPVYVDGPYTPDYVGLDGPGDLYRGWMESGCSLLGSDRRSERVTPSHAARDREQSLYGSWDRESLRLAWTGAYWGDPATASYGDGDLWIYLNVGPGGSTEIHNPYATPQPTVYLPGMTPGGTAAGAMEADFALWVEDSATAWLLVWDGDSWETAARLGEEQYRFQPGLNGGTTDLRLPFELLGIADPAGTELDLIAFATEKESLHLWAVLPRANPVSSERVVGRSHPSDDEVTFALHHAYHWPGLGAGVCPNGSQGLVAGQRPYPAAEVEVGMTVDPPGTVYRYLGDHLFPWWRLLLGDRPAEAGNLLTGLDSDHDLLRDGQEVIYTLRYRNAGQETTQDVRFVAWTKHALTLPDGVSLEPADHRYYQEVSVGDLEPGQEGSVQIRGVVDLDWASPAYEACLAAHPAQPRYCDLELKWALLEVVVFDQTHDEAAGPLEWISVDHRVDHRPPEFFGIHRPQYLIAANGPGGLYGYAYDSSGVYSLDVEVQAPTGASTVVACTDATPHDGRWQCSWEPAGVNSGVPPQDGDRFQVRLQAEDGAGHVSETSNWQPLVVDGLAPSVTVHPTATLAIDGFPLGARSLRLSGRALDNRGLQGVQVCLSEECQPARLCLDAPDWHRDYADVPPTPIPIDASVACGQDAIVRTYEVIDSFAVGAVSLSFQAEHLHRNQIRAELISPAGTRVQVLGDDYDLSTQFEHLNVMLTDAAASGLHDLRQDHELPGADYPHTARPYQPLRAFAGEEAAGTWQLVICDAHPAEENGWYHHSRLTIQPRDTASLSGTWSYLQEFKDLDDVEQTLAVYGIDVVGNRTVEPVRLTFRVDNVAPEIVVTEQVDEVRLLSDLSPVPVLAGSASDGGGVRRMYAFVHDPSGGSRTERVFWDESGWRFDLRPRAAGDYQIWVVAEDQAGSRTSVGPYGVEARGIWIGRDVFLPLIYKASGAGPVPLVPRLWLPLVLKDTMPARRGPEVIPTVTPTPVPTLTVTPTLTLAPTATGTPILTATSTVTPTATLVPAATPTLTPTFTITPTLTPTATGTLALTPTLTARPTSTPSLPSAVTTTLSADPTVTSTLAPP